MADSKARGSSAGMTTILMIAALVLIAGLFWWLSVKAEPTQITVVEEDSASARVDANPDATDITLADFSSGPPGFQSLNIRLRDVSVVSVLGARAFWIQLTNNQPYLIHIGDDLAAGGASVANGDTVTVSGIVHLMSDSILNTWHAAGALTDDMMEEARFAQSYLDARTVD